MAAHAKVVVLLGSKYFGRMMRQCLGGWFLVNGSERFVMPGKKYTNNCF